MNEPPALGGLLYGPLLDLLLMLFLAPSHDRLTLLNIQQLGCSAPQHQDRA